MGNSSYLRFGAVAAVVAASLLVVAFGDPGDVEPSTRSFEATGSLGRDSHIELYLVGGIYTHQIETYLGCAATAGLFPAQREPAAALREVLEPSDLAAYMPSVRARRTGGFRIDTPGWVTLQVGTGPACVWTYQATGRFLPLGEEPGPAGSLDQPWLLWSALAAAVVAAAVVAAVYRGRRRRGGEPQVRVLEPDSHRTT